MAQNDAIVIGAGIVGLSCARALAGAGLEVLVVERRRAGAEASSAAAGILAAQAEAGLEPPLQELALRGRAHVVDLCAALETETGVVVDRSPRGVLVLAFDDDDEGQLEQAAAAQAARGLKVEALGAREVLEAEPNVNPALRRGLFFPDDHSVDNVRLVRALATSVVARGAALLTGRPATSLLVEGGRVAGVRSGNETFRAPAVVNAMGAWAGHLGNDPMPPPVEPVRGVIAAFETTPSWLRRVVYSRRGYLVPRGSGQVLAGSTTERAGFDKSVTAGALRSVLGSALELAPMLADVPLAAHWAGLRPGTPDGLPVIGAGILPGLYVAGGLYRHGILLGALVGEIAAGLVLGRTPPVDLGPFAPTRFGLGPG